MTRGIDNKKDQERAEYQRLWKKDDYEKNKEYHQQKQREWYAKNKERVIADNATRRAYKLPKERVLWRNAKNRAVAHNIPFDIEETDIIVPACCPILGIPLVINMGHAKDNSPSLDRIDHTKGYVKGNIQVVSHKANTIKSNATLEELQRVVLWMKNLAV